MVRYVAPIDPHVHLRGEEYREDFFTRGFKDAQKVGLCAMIEQPNFQPPAIDALSIAQRMKRAWKEHPEIIYKIHGGITSDLKQVEQMLGLIQRGEFGLVSDKIFYVHSTGNMGILDPEMQKEIWKLKAKMGYTGVSVGHFEDEKLFTGEFDPARPETHSLVRNELSETHSVGAQLENAAKAGFKGIFYIAHASTPNTVELAEEYRAMGVPFEIVIEATWHHLFLNTEDYKTHGNLLKMNPPLRPKATQEGLLECALEGRIQTIGSDHAPHPPALKRGDNPKSGIPAGPFIPKGAEILINKGIDKKSLHDMIFNNSNRIFKFELPRREVEIVYNPMLWVFYGYNPFCRVDGTSS